MSPQGAPAAELNDLVLVGEGADCRKFKVVQRGETLNQGLMYGVVPADGPQEDIRFKRASGFVVQPKAAAQQERLGSAGSSRARPIPSRKICGSA